MHLCLEADAGVNSTVRSPELATRLTKDGHGFESPEAGQNSGNRDDQLEYQVSSLLLEHKSLTGVILVRAPGWRAQPGSGPGSVIRVRIMAEGHIRQG